MEYIIQETTEKIYNYKQENDLTLLKSLIGESKKIDKLFEQFSSIKELLTVTSKELESLKFSEKQIEKILSFVELYNRIEKDKKKIKEQVYGSAGLAKKLISEIGQEKQEHLVALYLDTQNKIIEQKTIFIGSVNKSIAEPREILHYAIKNMATSLIVSHNHPSGSIEPSREDNKFTETLRGASDLLGVTLLDHLIVTDSKYYSYREENNIL